MNEIKFHFPEWTKNKGQRVELIMDSVNIRNAKVANAGDRGILLSDYVDLNGMVRIKLDNKHYPQSISVMKLKAI